MLGFEEYTKEFPKELAEFVDHSASEIAVSWGKGDFIEAEKNLKIQYEVIRGFEKKLPEGQRFHKGNPLHNWGVAILLQRNKKRISKGYLRILLAFVEDLLDFTNINQVKNSPAYRALITTPFVSSNLLKKITSEVQKRKKEKIFHKIPTTFYQRH